MKNIVEHHTNNTEKNIDSNLEDEEREDETEAGNKNKEEETTKK